MKNKLVYLNQGGFGDTDITVLHCLNERYDLIWFYVDEPLKKVNLSKEEALEYARKYNIEIRIKTRFFKIRSLKNLLFFKRIIKDINKINPDVVFTCINEWSLSLQVASINCKNIIHGVHDVKPHSKQFSIKNIMTDYIIKKTIKSFPYNAVFSKNQYDLFKLYYGDNVVNLGMSVKDFGKSDKSPKEFGKTIDLLFFGYIVKYKGLDLLINTLEGLLDEGINCFRLTIAGKGPYWEKCESLVKTPSLYNLSIRFVENKEVPDLMSSHHFLILPYRDATQSGPLLTALNYGLPIIAPNFGCFSDTYNPQMGILYDRQCLRDALLTVMKMNENDYQEMRNACQKAKETFSEEAIANNYIKLFDEVCG